MSTYTWTETTPRERASTGAVQQFEEELARAAAVRRGIDLGISERVLAAASGWSRSTVRRLHGHAG